MKRRFRGIGAKLCEAAGKVHLGGATNIKIIENILEIRKIFDFVNHSLGILMKKKTIRSRKR